MWVNGEWIDEIAGEIQRLRQADPKQIRRPEKLSGLSPWQDSEGSASARESLVHRAAEAITTLDERVAWVEPGNIGKADSVVSVYAAEEMTVTVGGRSFTLHDGETLEIFHGTKPPLEKIIRSATFAANIGVLVEYLETFR
jgi:hypothetical protein